MEPTGIKVLIPSDGDADDLIAKDVEAFDAFFRQHNDTGMIGVESELLKMYLRWKVKEPKPPEG